MLESFIAALLYIVHAMGYAGIFVLSAIESTFVPVGIEFTLVPAGYLAFEGKLMLPLVFASSLGGSITGSIINYTIAYRWGRGFLLRHQKALMMSEKKLQKMEGFFNRHGAFAVFLGRLMYGIRHYISFPAGLARMDFKKFVTFTAIGDALWVSILLGLGYAAGGNETELHEAMPAIKIGVLLLVVGMGLLYAWRVKRKRNLKKSQT